VSRSGVKTNYIVSRKLRQILPRSCFDHSTFRLRQCNTELSSPQVLLAFCQNTFFLSFKGTFFLKILLEKRNTFCIARNKTCTKQPTRERMCFIPVAVSICRSHQHYKNLSLVTPARHSSSPPIHTGLTEQWRRTPAYHLIEDVEVALASALPHHPGFLQQICNDMKKYEKLGDALVDGPIPGSTAHSMFPFESVCGRGEWIDVRLITTTHVTAKSK